MLTYARRSIVLGMLIAILIFVVVFCVTSVDALGESTPQERTKNILVIHTYNQGLSMTDMYDDYISEAFLRTNYELSDIYTEYLDEIRIDYNNDYEAFSVYISQKYKDTNIDGVVCIGQGSYDFVNTYYEANFASLPVIHMGVDGKLGKVVASDNIRGINQEVPFESLFIEAKNLNSGLNKINIYSGSKDLIANYTETLKSLSEAYNVLYEVHSDAEAERYLEDILDMDKNDAVIILSALYDKEGYVYTLDYLFDEIDLKADVPVYTIEEYYVGKGATGAALYDQSDYVLESVKLLIDMMDGTYIERDLSASKWLKPTKVFDYVKIRQFGLDEKELSSGSIIKNRPSLVETIQSNSLEFIILALIIITVILIFSVTNLLLRLKAEKDREDARKDLQLSYMELEAAHEQLVAGEGELTRQFRELQLKEDELRTSRERYRLAAKGSEFGIWDYDIENGRMYFSNKGKEILGLAVHQSAFETNEFYGLFDPKDEIAFRRVVASHLKRKIKVVEYETRLMIDGKKEWISIRGKALFDENQVATRLAGSLTNITQEKEADEKMYRIVFFDELTGLNNRAYFNSELRSICEDGNCDKVAMIFIDLDNFKTINDSLGHKYGDQVLKKIAGIISKEVADEHKIIRFGGDEFIIIIKDYVDIEDINDMASHLNDIFRNKFDIEGVGFKNTISMGIALYPEDSDNIDILLKRADLALNEAKAKGRDQYVYYEDRLEEIMNHNLWYERELSTAIDEAQFELYYQAKYNIRTDKISGYEALIRWHHPEKGLIPPDEFIPIAEENGMIIKIGEWVVKEAVAQLDEWHRRGYDYLTMSINLSAKQFKEVKLEELVHTAMSGKCVKTHQIELEITETTALHDVDYATLLLGEFRNQGYKVALDDFGTGYSSLNYLNTLPIDTLKIDKTFITNSMVDDAGKQIIKTVIQLAHIHNMEVVAEGVETKEQLDFLKRENCDVIQGYYISRPVPKNDAIELIDRALELV